MKERYCSFIIWGNGLRYSSEIIDAIRATADLEIKGILFHELNNIDKFIKQVYSKDYAPFFHLKAKTKYLLKSEPKVIIIFALDKNPQEEFFGEGDFRHLESISIKKLKEDIRNKYNPKNSDGIRTEEHVIHATDSEHQVDHLLKLLGYREGVEYFKKNSNSIIKIPYYLPNFTNFKIKKVDVSSIYCNIIRGNKNSFYLEKCKLEDSPHYKFLMGDTLPYRKYLDEFAGSLLSEDYSIAKFKSLAENFSYLDESWGLSYILAKEFQLNKYLIQDGLHRASILVYRKHDAIPVAIIL